MQTLLTQVVWSQFMSCSILFMEMASDIYSSTFCNITIRLSWSSAHLAEEQTCALMFQTCAITDYTLSLICFLYWNGTVSIFHKYLLYNIQMFF